MSQMIDIEAVVVSYLNRKLGNDVPVSTDVPEMRPMRFVTVERTGGGYDSLIIDRPTVAVQCWAETRLDASQLAIRVRSALLRMEYDLDSIASIDVTSLYNFPADGGRQPRYQVVADIIITP